MDYNLNFISAGVVPVSQTGPSIDSLKQASDNLPLAQRFGPRLVMAIRPRGIEVFREPRRATTVRQFGQ
jgi:hypothetical protein